MYRAVIAAAAVVVSIALELPETYDHPIQQPVFSETELRMRLGEHGLRDLQIDLVVAQADEFGVEWDS